MKQLGFLVHTDKCIGCRSCEFSCKNEHGENDTLRRKVHHINRDPEIRAMTFEHFSMSCNHCESPGCMFACPENAITKKKNGVVIIDQTACNGCGKCIPACPFDSIAMNPLTAKADKCDMCYERQQNGKQTICVSSCPVHAIEIIDIYDQKNAHYEKNVSGFSMKKMTKPSIRFSNKKEGVKHFWSV